MTTRLGDEVHGELKILSALQGKSMLEIITECIEECFGTLAEEASKLLKKKGNRSRGGVFLGTSWRKPLVLPRLSKGGDRSHRSRTEVECGGGKECPIAKSLEKQGLETSEWKEACHPVNGYEKSIS